MTNGYLEYELIKDLKLKTSISVDLGNSNTHYFQPSTAGRALLRLQVRSMLIWLIKHSGIGPGFLKIQYRMQNSSVTILSIF